MHPRISTAAGVLLVYIVLSAADAEPWNAIDAPATGQLNQRVLCNPQQNRETKRVIKQMRPLLRRLLLSMVSLQHCRDHATSDLCSTPPPIFSRHHHCRLFSLLQHAAQACKSELQCKLPTACTGCTSASQSNIAALQWLFPRHSYCSDSQFKKVGTHCRESCLAESFYFLLDPVCAASHSPVDCASKNCRRCVTHIITIVDNCLL